MKPTVNQIEREILRIVQDGNITPVALNRTLSQRFGLRSDAVKPVVNGLISQGLLAYSDRHGRTVIEKSFAKPVRISNYVILKPPGTDFIADNADVAVDIARGAAFGNGQHPSTRVAVRAIEHVLRDTLFLRPRTESVVLDIGTGTGVLAIAALRLGITRALGIDTDPGARYEAALNAEINDVGKRFEVSNAPLEDLRGTFDIVVANLRYPTLIRICSNISTLVKRPGAVVLSGIKVEESEKVMNTYKARQFSCAWKATEKSWCSLVLYI